MSRRRILESAVTMVVAIEEQTYESLRQIAFREHRSMADLVREGLDMLIASRGGASSAARPCSETGCSRPATQAVLWSDRALLACTAHLDAALHRAANDGADITDDPEIRTLGVGCCPHCGAIEGSWQ